jgi:hypothetical protein
LKFCIERGYQLVFYMKVTCAKHLQAHACPHVDSKGARGTNVWCCIGIHPNDSVFSLGERGQSQYLVGWDQGKSSHMPIVICYLWLRARCIVLVESCRLQDLIGTNKYRGMMAMPLLLY